MRPGTARTRPGWPRRTAATRAGALRPRPTRRSVYRPSPHPAGVPSHPGRRTRKGTAQSIAARTRQPDVELHTTGRHRRRPRQPNADLPPRAASHRARRQPSASVGDLDPRSRHGPATRATAERPPNATDAASIRRWMDPAHGDTLNAPQRGRRPTDGDAPQAPPVRTPRTRGANGRGLCVVGHEADDRAGRSIARQSTGCRFQARSDSSHKRAARISLSARVRGPRSPARCPRVASVSARTAAQTWRVINQ